jgi:hypothetical protein
MDRVLIAGMAAMVVWPRRTCMGPGRTWAGPGQRLRHRKHLQPPLKPQRPSPSSVPSSCSLCRNSLTG